jgi:hypothetical protein
MDDVKTPTITKRQLKRHKEKLKKNKQKSQDQDQSDIDNIKKMSKAKDEKTVEELIKMATDIWVVLKKLIKTDPSFTELPDKKKLDHFRTKLGYAEFMNEYPVTTRYMICMGQYSTKAFKRFLNKIRLTIHPPANKRDKGYMEDQWVRRQADYVQYLWESYQKGHYNNAERSWIWKDAYKNLKGEFDDFRDKYKSIEKSTKEEKVKHKASNARDLLERLRTGEQTLSKDDTISLLKLLKNKLYKRNFSNTLLDMMTKVKYIESSCEGYGIGPEAVTDSDKPVIRMIEHIDASRMSEIPTKYLLDQTTANKLPVNIPAAIPSSLAAINEI